MASKKTEVKAQEQHACPNCGYCPHCGRSDQHPPVIPAPYPAPVPFRPLPRPYPYWYGEGKVWSGGSSVAPRFGSGNSTTPEHLRSAPTTYC